MNFIIPSCHGFLHLLLSSPYDFSVKDFFLRRRAFLEIRKIVSDDGFSQLGEHVFIAKLRIDAAEVQMNSNMFGMFIRNAFGHIFGWTNVFW